jgi:hypothetical protein
MIRDARCLHCSLCLVFGLALASCSNGTEGARVELGAAVAPSPIPNTPGDSETPATGSSQLVADWLASGAYRKWRCEPEAHEARSPSPHGKNRVCNNRKIAEHGAGEFPVGSASVKEVFDDLGALHSYAIELKTSAGASQAWIWYMQKGTNVLVNARGNQPEAADCNACHLAAGSDKAHSGHDFVYTIVAPAK